eukprot:8548092-Pyramimonas_sp.AAC.1
MIFDSKDTCKVHMDQCTTDLRDSHGVLRGKPTDIMANHRLVLILLERKRCSGHHQHVSVCKKELSMAAQYTPKMQSLFVESVHIAHDLFQATRDLFHGDPYLSIVLASNARGCDSDDPSLPRRLDGSISRPPSGGLVCPACADNFNVHSPSHDGDPRYCRWHDNGDYYWERPN